MIYTRDYSGRRVDGHFVPLARNPKGLSTLLYAYDSKETIGGEPSFESILAREVVAGNPRALELVRVRLLRLSLESSAGILTSEKANEELTKYRDRLAYTIAPIILRLNAPPERQK